MTNSDLVKTGLQEGARMVRARWGLVVILYAFTLILGMLIAVPIYLGVVKHVGPTGFGADLIESFDTLLWREIVIKLTDTLTGFGIQLILVLPLYWIWKTVAHMGVIYALHNGAIFFVLARRWGVCAEGVGDQSYLFVAQSDLAGFKYDHRRCDPVFFPWRGWGILVYCHFNALFDSGRHGDARFISTICLYGGHHSPRFNR